MSLREALNILPPGDMRNCVCDLASTEPMLQKLLQYRFTNGMCKGQSLDNLFLAALSCVNCGCFEKAVSSMHEVLGIAGKALPVKIEDADADIVANFEDRKSPAIIKSTTAEYLE